MHACSAFIGWCYNSLTMLNFSVLHFQSSHLLLICSPEVPNLMLGLLFFEGGYILLYDGTPNFWQRGLWDSCFQNPSESSDFVSFSEVLANNMARTEHICFIDINYTFSC